MPTATAARAFDVFAPSKRIEIDAYGAAPSPPSGGGTPFIVGFPFKPHPAIRSGI